MRFTPPSQGPRTWLGKTSFSLLFAVLGPGIFLGGIHAALGLFRKLEEIYGTAINISVFSSEEYAFVCFAGSFLAAGFYGWIVAGADRERWRLHLCNFQWGGLITALVASSIFALHLFDPLPASGVNFASRLHLQLALLSLLAPVVALGWIVFLTAFWWGKELDALALAELDTDPGNLIKIRRRRQLIAAVAGHEPHLGRLIVQLPLFPLAAIGAVYAPAHLLDKYAIPWRVESGLEANVETSSANFSGAKEGTLLIISDKLATVDGNGIRLDGGTFDPRLGNWLKKQSSPASELVLIVRAPPEITHSTLIRVIEAARHLGIRHFRFLGMDDE